MTTTQDAIKLLTEVTDTLLKVCDGAQTRDAQGFNKPDADIVRTAYPDMVTIAPRLPTYRAQIERAGFRFDLVQEAIKDVSGPLPTHNWGEHKITFGEHNGMTYEHMAGTQRGYLSWMVREIDHDDPRRIAAKSVLLAEPIPNPEQIDKPRPKVTISITQNKQKIYIKYDYAAKDMCRSLSTRCWTSGGWVCPIDILLEVYETFQGVRDEFSVKYSNDFFAALEVASITPIEKIEVDGNDPGWIDALSMAFGDSAHALHDAINSDEPILEHFGNGKKLMPFQKAGVLFIDRNNGNALLTDHMGVGKTIQALGYLALHPEQRPVVIVCPASLKINWKREAEAWLETQDTIEIVTGGKPHALTADITIINYEVIKKWLPTLKEYAPSILIYDEAHLLKSPKSQRSKAAKALASITPHKLLLTGTPVLGKPADLWNLLQIVDPKHYPDRMFFRWHLKFADAHKIYIGREQVMVGGKMVWQPKTAWDFSGASNLEELAESLKRIMIRRTKDEVLPELPEKRRTTILIPIDNRREYNKADKEFVAWLAEQKDENVAKQASHVEQLAKLEYLRQIAVRGKMKAVIEWIQNMLETGEKLIVFATHTEPINRLMKVFGECAVRVDGSVTGEKRQAAVDAFQDDRVIKLFVGNIKAAGVGLTLTAASNVAFIEMPYTPAELEQAEDRAHRISQKNAVNAWYLVSENTIDEKIAGIIERKRDVIDMITGDENTLSFDLFDLLR